ncbi:tudor domain-containing protein 5 [Pseudonaja textilis]|uniref:tudor domain-containing protein 5 n=1 Tax=Pseudonaja textilis TaxID=8673 RepID=UPI000EA9C339|nr:tudor domain-containing protein 5 [Pseudonaja textilis]
MTDQEQRMNALKKEVRSLLTAIKEGLTPCQLEQEYKLMIGKTLPLRMLGYHSVMELVKDMPDTVHISPKGDGSVILKAIADESTKRIASLVARQKSRSKPQHSKYNRNYSLPSTICSQVPSHPKHSLSLPRHGGGPPILPPVIKSELKEMLRFSPVLLSDFDKVFTQRFGRKFEFMRYGFFSMFEVLNAASDIIQIVQTRVGSLVTLKECPLMKQPEMTECKMAVKSCEAEQTLHAAAQEPVARMPSPVLPMDVLCSITDQKSDDLQMQTKLVESPKVRTEKEIKIVLSQKGPGGIVSSELKEKIKTIVSQYPNGLHASKLPGEFEEYFHEKLAVRKLGFLNLMELIGALNDVLRIECREGEKDWLIFDIDSQSLPDEKQRNGKISQSDVLACQEATEEHELPTWDSPSEDSLKLETKFHVVTKMVMPHLGIKKDNIIQEIMEEEIPPDAVQDETLYSLPKFDKNAFVGLFVEDIVSPSQFHVRIYGGETSDELENIMIEMRRCYSSKYVANRYVIPETFIRPGQLCCVKNSKDKWWYRVIIHRLLNDQEVEVFYPDFGNITIVQKSSLRLLKHCYAKLSAQVIPCCLAWVKPSKGDWSVSAIKEFRRLCELKLLVGLVDEYINDVLYLFLCDTSSDDDIYLHNVLKLEGHAVICRENIPSKGFKELNPFTLYIKPNPNPNQHADFIEADTSLLQQDSLINFPGTNSETCNNEVVSQHTASQSSDPEVPYLEPVYLCQEIWDENWLPSTYYEKKKHENISDDLHTDIVVSDQTSGDEGNKNKIQHNQGVIQKTGDASSAIEAADDPNLEHPNEILSLTAETKTESFVGDTPDYLSQTLEEFYVSIVHSKEPGKLSQNESDVNKLTACHFQLPPSTSVLHGRPASENTVNDAPGTQTVSVYNANHYFEPCALGHNALVFTAELQGSPKFYIPYSPAVALGASARLAASGRYFPFNFRKMIPQKSV